MIALSLRNVRFIFAISGLLFATTVFLNLYFLNQTLPPCAPTFYSASGRYKIDQKNGHHHLAVIVPFRERLNPLLRFVPHMHQFLNRQNISHEFFIINQVDQYRFNRGALINVGFLLAQNGSATYIAMHDVDLLPLNDQLSYGFPERGPFHVSAPGLHPKYHYKTFVGGILLIQNQHFVRVNGFSTQYFGWGLEDDEFYARMKEAHLQIYRPENVATDINNTFLHLHDEQLYKRDTAKFFNQREVTRKRDRLTGLNTTRFQLLGVHHLVLEGVQFRLFDVALHCDLEKTPWCQRPSSPKLNHRSNKTT